MSDDNIELLKDAIDDAIADGEGRVYADHLKRNLEKHGLSVVTTKPVNQVHLADRFLMWPLPKSVRSDLCVTMEYKFPRSGTNLLSADEARQMIEYLFSDE